MSKLSALAFACVAVSCSEKKDDATPATAFDACTLMPREQVEARLGEPDGASHSIAGTAPVIGTCRQRLAGEIQITLTVRSLADFDAMSESGTELAGLGETAVRTDKGVVMKVAGQPHFFQVLVTGPTGVEIEKAIELAKIVAANAR